VATAGGATASYLYDARGERLSKTVGKSVTQYQFDQADHLIAESDGKNATVIREYVWLGELPLAQIESNGTIDYVHADQTNTPQKMTNASQAVVWDRVQQPFGETTSTAGTATSNLRAHGQYADAESALNYNLMRDYDPTLGRYIEADPIGLLGGVNLYVYAGQNPVMRSDSFGLCAQTDSHDPTVGDPGFWESLIPVWGSGRQAINDFQEGRWGWGLFDTALAVTDLFLIKALVTAPIRAILETGAREIATKGMGGRLLTEAEQAEFSAFADRARSVGLQESPYRTGSWGVFDANGEFTEVTRIDVGDLGQPGWRGQTHVHIAGQDDHLPLTTRIPGEP
jgi:RHS repeat-associated protein